MGANRVRTLKASGEIDALFKTGRRGGTDLISVLSIETPPRRGPDGRVVFVAGKKLGNAVMRNRCKRVMREALRRAGGPWPGVDVALVARGRIADASPEAIDSALTRALQRCGVIS
jgi:ribonuclease P protein component